MKRQIAFLLSLLSLGVGAGVLGACDGDSGQSSSSPTPQPTVEEIRTAVTPYSSAALSVLPEVITQEANNQIKVSYQVPSGNYVYDYLTTESSFGDNGALHFAPKRATGELAELLGVELSAYASQVVADDYHIFFKHNFSGTDKYYVKAKEPTGGTPEMQKGCFAEITQAQYAEIQNVLGFQFLASDDFAFLFDAETYGDVVLWNDVNNQSYCEYVYSGEPFTVGDVTLTEAQIRFDLYGKQINMDVTLNEVTFKLILPMYYDYEAFRNLYDVEEMKFFGKTTSDALVVSVNTDDVIGYPSSIDVYPSIDLDLKYMQKRLNAEGSYKIALTETVDGKTTEYTYYYTHYLNESKIAWVQKYKCEADGNTVYKNQGEKLVYKLGDKYVESVDVKDDPIFQKLPSSSTYQDVRLEWNENFEEYRGSGPVGSQTELMLSFTKETLTFTVVYYSSGKEFKRQTFVYSDIGTTPTVELPEAQPCTIADILSYAVATKTYDFRKDRGLSVNYCLTNGNGYGVKGTVQAEDGKYYAVKGSYQYEVSEAFYNANMPHNSSEYAEVFDAENYQKVGDEYKLTFNDVEYTVTVEGVTLMFTPSGSRDYNTLHSLEVLNPYTYTLKECETSSYLTLEEVKQAVDNKNYSCAGYQVLGDVYKQDNNYYYQKDGVWYQVYSDNGEVCVKRLGWSLGIFEETVALLNKVISDMATENYTEYEEYVEGVSYCDKDGKYINVSFTAKHESRAEITFRVYENANDYSPDEYSLYAFGKSNFTMPTPTVYIATAEEIQANFSSKNYVITLSTGLVIKRDGDNFTYGDDIYIKSGDKYTVYEKQGDGSYVMKQNVSAAFPSPVLDDVAGSYWMYESNAGYWWTGGSISSQRLYQIDVSADGSYLFTNIEYEETFTISGFGSVKVTAPTMA